MKWMIAALAILAMASQANAQWKPAGDKIKTEWGEKLDPNNVWNVYPRPIMERTEWQNLNGQWNYAITAEKAQNPSSYDGKILVPFAVESSLSGVGKTLDRGKVLWYQRNFEVPSKWRSQRVLLHFGAVDWRADVWVNGVKVGVHTGGYTPFSFDVTDALKSGKNSLEVRVFDNTDDGFQPRGKQKRSPEGIWYTPVSGIWQTVWLEPVAKTHIEDLKILPNIDDNTLSVDVKRSTCDPSIIAEVKVFDGSKQVAVAKAVNGQAVDVRMPENVKLWSPSSPFLYDLEVTISSNGKVLDKVKSYAAMRKFSMGRDANNILRLQLNNKPLFQFGQLDQGWWPDGLYTAPSYEALIYDIDKQKEWGYNMIRKHVKVEPAVWYTYCDRVGMIVWQDMPSGEICCPWDWNGFFKGKEWQRSAESEANYRKEWKEIIDYLYSYPSIGMWIPFNEAWGQFKTVEITNWTKQYDPSRIVNQASGGNFFECGDVIDQHHYPQPYMRFFDMSRVNILGEYGGIGFPMKGHLWTPDRNWGYIKFNSKKEVTDQYVKYGEMLLDFVKRGYSAGVYTQTTDVEVEVNGVMTYDRKEIKMDESRIREINQRLCNSLNEK